MAGPSDIDAIADAASAYLAEQCNFARLRRLIAEPPHWDAALWQGFGVELGFAGLGIAEEAGGAGMSLSALARVAEVLGYHLCAMPWFESCFYAAGILAECGAVQALAGIASGQDIATVAERDAAGSRGKPAVRLTGGLLDGTAHFVPHGLAATHYVLAAQDEHGGSALFYLPRTVEGLQLQGCESLDLTRPFAALHLHKVAAEPYRLAEDGACLGAVQRQAQLVLAAEAVGGMQRSLDELLLYAKQRVQFGRLIGSFQAMKHRIADMQLTLEAARSALAWGLAEAGSNAAADIQAAGAFSYCARAYHQIAGEAIQLHGGIGFTWEHHAHLYFKRARATLHLLEEPRALNARVADYLLQA